MCAVKIFQQVNYLKEKQKLKTTIAIRGNFQMVPEYILLVRIV